MKVLIEGHKYEVANFESKETEGQVIQFIQKEPVKEGSTELKTVADGTTNEELIAVLVDRLKFLDNKFPCIENQSAIFNLEESLNWLNQRTANRVNRNVEGKNER